MVKFMKKWIVISSVTKNNVFQNKKTLKTNLKFSKKFNQIVKKVFLKMIFFNLNFI